MVSKIIELCLSLVIVVHNFAKDKRKLLKFFWLYKWHNYIAKHKVN
jgi:hypothetical protein